MSRFLTPSKVGLLALISLYVESNKVPKTSTVSILSFIVSQLLPTAGLVTDGQDGERAPGESRESVGLTIDDFQKATSKHPSGIPGRTIWDLFLNKIWELNSFDALNEFFDSLAQILPKPREDLLKEAESQSSQLSMVRLSRASPLGAFVRRARLEFTRLQLHDSIALWKNFVFYRQPTLSIWRRRNPTATRTSFDANLATSTSKVHDLLYESLDSPNLTMSSSSMEDVEKFLEFQVDQMQSKPTNQLGLRKCSYYVVQKLVLGSPKI